MYKIGYFSTSQQITFGKTKSKHIIYKINVFNDYKNYLVSYGGSVKGKMIIKFKPLDDDKNAIIIDVIGLMDDSNLIITLQYIHNIFYKLILTH